jgi:alpha-amylase/alpha-mannosidase (GH57 family)
MTVAFLWHLHQPDYRDPRTGVPAMPWVRLHALRGYRDLAADLLDHEMPATVNVVPSLLDQLLHYASDGQDRHLDLTRIPADAVTDAERGEIVGSFVAGNPRMIGLWPTYARIAAKTRAAEPLSTSELRDLQVWSTLAWCGSHAITDEPVLAELREKGRGFTESDKASLLQAQRRLLSDLPDLWRRMATSGVVAISASPYYHPILPLLVDTAHARRCMPHLGEFPRFSRPDDARRQLVSARERVHEVLGVSPAGLWPSEGSVSPEVANLAREAGFRWLATDEGILDRSERDGGRGAGPWDVSGILAFFRDRALSDRLGFDVAQRDPIEAADAFADALAQRRDLVVVALDGENPWEAFPDGGARFRARLDARLRGDAVRLDEIQRPVGRIRQIHTGSWIGADFQIWFGHPDDHAGWELLARTRAAIDAAPPERREAALRAVLPAEGSDWFWWYGPEFSTPFAGVFDQLFRAHLRAAWEALGEAAPAELDRPIGVRADDVIPPKEAFTPPDDPDARDLAWSGAGRLVVRAGAMARDGLRAEIRWGWTKTGAFWVRIPASEPDPGDHAPIAIDDRRIRIDNPSILMSRGHTATLITIPQPADRFTLRLWIGGVALPPEAGWQIIRPADLHRALWIV